MIEGSDRMTRYNGVIRESVRGVIEEVVRDSHDKLGWWGLPAERKLFSIEGDMGKLFGSRLKTIAYTTTSRLTRIAMDVLTKEYGLDRSILLRSEIRDSRDGKEWSKLEEMIGARRHFVDVRKVIKYHPSNIPGVGFKFTTVHDKKDYEIVYERIVSIADTKRHMPAWFLTGAYAIIYALETLGSLGKSSSDKSTPPPHS